MFTKFIYFKLIISSQNRIQKDINNTLNKFEEYKNNLKKMKDGEKNSVLKTLNILEKEVKRVDKYISLLQKLK